MTDGKAFVSSVHIVDIMYIRSILKKELLAHSNTLNTIKFMCIISALMPDRTTFYLQTEYNEYSVYKIGSARHCVYTSEYI